MPSCGYPCVCGPISTVTAASSRPIGAYIDFTVPYATMLELTSPFGGSAAAVSSGTWPIFFHALTSPKSALHSSQTSMRAAIGSTPSCLRNSTREPSRHSARTTAARSGIVVPPRIVNIDLSRRVKPGSRGRWSFILKPFHLLAQFRPRSSKAHQSAAGASAQPAPAFRKRLPGLSRALLRWLCKLGHGSSLGKFASRHVPSGRHPPVTAILRGCAWACFGMRSVSTPSFRLASMRAVSSSPLRVKLRR